MNTYNDLYNFIDIARNNRKYPDSTANNLKSALKIFGRELTESEISSTELIEQNIEDIFINVINKNKDKSIGSLNTYKARLIKVIGDYKRYGADPTKIQSWIKNTRKSTPLLNTEDKQDKNQDKEKIDVSALINTPVDNVHKIELSFRTGSKTILHIPSNITQEEANKIKNIIDSLAN